MANEINFAYKPGLILEAAIYANGWVQQGANIPLTETGAGTALYVGSVPGVPAIADGVYQVLFVDTIGPPANEVVGRGSLYWSGNAEDREAVQGFIEGGRNIDFIGSDALGWQRVERDVAGVLLRRYNLFDQNGDRIDESVAAFIARSGMISSEVAI